MNSFGRTLLDVMAVEPVQLLGIEDGGRGRNPLQGEFLDQLRLGENLAVTAARRPSQQRQVVHQRLGKNSHLPEVGDRRSTVAFGKPLPVRPEDRGKMSELRDR